MTRAVVGMLALSLTITMLCFVSLSFKQESEVRLSVGLLNKELIGLYIALGFLKHEVISILHIPSS